ncbi:protein kinase domain-containing protein [Haliangium ochraceum]|uniref:Serine/threonine protein kinase n=1 Tax=Haliangium ochraceum (strain DSM 14365 / JCM 11303 / SMP-2) TaxID=502025 RepID=D0LJ53_HALO1|nr:protein kinase [Haliangium ochraceum]ACY14900.1 serine/threonine protein kinase [Haliangium ochraceum DSM 14365]
MDHREDRREPEPTRRATSSDRDEPRGGARPPQGERPLARIQSDDTNTADVHFSRAARHRQSDEKERLRAMGQALERERVAQGSRPDIETRFPPGTLLAERYRIMRLAGRGGMGEVYSAEDLEIGQLVAIKILPAAWEQHPGRLERLRNEVRMARSVAHPNVCRVYDIGEADGLRFVTMEYVGGEDLGALLRRVRRLPPQRAAQLGVQICEGLAAIHSAGILHCDLKPANLMLDSHGDIRIADFGLASLATKRPEQGKLQGTPAYMAPEQFSRQEISIQSDLYALGLVLYKLFTGSPAYVADSVTKLHAQRTAGPPPPPSLRVADVPPNVDAILQRCLQPKPALRPGSALEVALALAPAPSSALVTVMVVHPLDATSLAAELGDDSALRIAAAHAEILDLVCARHHGRRADDGRTLAILFDNPRDAVHAALTHQRKLHLLVEREGMRALEQAGHHLGAGVGIHFSAAAPIPGASESVASSARSTAQQLALVAAAGQILLTRGVFDLVRQFELAKREEDQGSTATVDPGHLRWLAHGDYELSEADEPVAVCEVGHPDQAKLAPPPDSERARRLMIQDVVVGWRPAPGLRLEARPSWRMERKLGEGGFGEVWLARHDSTDESRVFKFCYDAERLRGLQREIALFRLLGEALGEREDIVRILDWNLEEAPYFIESAYTAGGNLSAWAEEQGGAAQLPLAQRLEIIAQVATALAAAHSVGVLHKDVKPSNVLMATDAGGPPQAQLGDFGIGGVTDPGRLSTAAITALEWSEAAHSNTDGLAGSRMYMAPELLEHKPASTLADVYALGVMLYQIVVGDFSRALAPGWERDIDDPLLRGDIAAAVDGDPARRLSHAALLATRLRTLPERRSEAEERQRELVQHRHAAVVAARARRRRRIFAVAAVVLLIFAVTVTVQSLRIAEKARAAADAAQTAQKVSGFLVSLFDDVDPYKNENPDISAHEILDRSRDKIDALGDEPEVQASLMHVIGVVYRNIGVYREASALLEQAVAKRRALHGDEHAEVAESLHALAISLERQGLFIAAEEHAREAVRIRRALHGENHLGTAETKETLADVLVALDRFEEADRLYQNILETRRSHYGAEHPSIAQILRRIGTVQIRSDEFAAAYSSYGKALEMFRRLPGDHTLEIAKLLYYMGQALASRDELAEATRLHEESLALIRPRLGEDHPQIALAMDELAFIYQRTGQYERAGELLRELRDMHQASQGERSIGVANVERELAFLALNLGRCVEASEHAHNSLSILEELLPEGHNMIASAKGNLAYLLDVEGRHEEAERYHRDSYESYTRAQGSDSLSTYLTAINLAGSYIDAGALDKAAPLIDELSRQFRAQGEAISAELDWLPAHFDSVRGSYLAKLGDIAPAESLLRSAYDSLRELHGAHRLYTKRALWRLAEVHEQQGDAEQAQLYRAELGPPPCSAQL